MRFHLPENAGLKPPVRPHPVHGHVVEVPPVIAGQSGQLVKCAPGSALLPFPGHGFYTCAPGKWVDIPDTIPAAVVKASAPMLLTEEEVEALAAARAAEQPVEKPADPAPAVKPVEAAPAAPAAPAEVAPVRPIGQQAAPVNQQNNPKKIPS